MQTIVLLMGPHGSGKTTLADALDRQGSAIRLRQYTTRPKRDGENDEYRFVVGSQPDALWRYIKTGSEYGFTRSELAHLPNDSLGVVAVHSGDISWHKNRIFISEVFRFEELGVELITPGLYRVFFRDMEIGELNSEELCFRAARRVVRACQ